MRVAALVVWGGCGGVHAEVWSEARAPVDAAPLSDGSAVLYVEDGGGAICLVEGEETAPRCATGLVSGATAVVPSPDDALVYVAGLPMDGGRAAVGTLAGALVGAACSLFGGCRTAGGFQRIPGTEDHEVTALARLDGDELTFGGADPAGSAGLFRVPVEGGAVAAVVSGLDAVPTGVVVGDDGVVFAAGGGTVWEVSGGRATVLAEGLSLGSPAGLELSPDERTVMVSSLSESGRAQVLLVDREDGSTSVFDRRIHRNEAAGGLHRASGDPYTYAWADSSAGGSVYRVSFPR